MRYCGRNMRTPFRSWIFVAAILGGTHLGGCGPQFPPFWLIEADPQGPDGQVDGAGKLRVLAVQADPPEAAPGRAVALRALAVTHPRHGSTVDDGGGPQHSPDPLGVTSVWLACRPPKDASGPEPCGLEQGTAATDLRRLPSAAADPLAATLQIGADTALPDSLQVTLIVADGTFAGGAEACYAAAVANRGVSPSTNHCLIAVKQVRVSDSQTPNHNPQIAQIWFGGREDALLPLSSGAWTYERLAADLPDDARPRLVLAVDRADDAVEVGSNTDGTPRNESITATFFTTAGTLEAGRGSFLDLDCPSSPETCPQFPRSTIGWKPPAARAALETPDGRTFFFIVLRDDRGGVSFARGAAVVR